MARRQIMKLLVIGTDKSIFDSDSEARSRIDAYGRLFDELHIVIATPPGFRETATNTGVKLYPTNSRVFFLWPFAGYRIGKRIAREHKIDLVSA